VHLFNKGQMNYYLVMNNLRRALEVLALTLLAALAVQFIMTALYLLGSYLAFSDSLCLVLGFLANKLGWFCLIGGAACLIGLALVFPFSRSKPRFAVFSALAMALGYVNAFLINSLQAIFTKGAIL